MVAMRPQLPSTALMKVCRMVDDFVDNFFEIDNFLLDRCLKYGHKMVATMAPCKVVQRDMYKKAKQLKFMLLFTKG